MTRLQRREISKCASIPLLASKYNEELYASLTLHVIRKQRGSFELMQNLPTHLTEDNIHI